MGALAVPTSKHLTWAKTTAGLSGQRFQITVYLHYYYFPKEVSGHFRGIFYEPLQDLSPVPQKIVAVTVV